MADPVSIALITSAGLSIAGAEQGKVQSDIQASQYRLQSVAEQQNARIEKIQAKKDADSINRELARVESSQDAIFASRGLLQGHGSASAARTASREAASRDIDERLFGGRVRSNNALGRSASSLLSASSAKSAGRANRLQGYANAFHSGSSLFGES